MPQDVTRQRSGQAFPSVWGNLGAFRSPIGAQWPQGRHPFGRSSLRQEKGSGGWWSGDGMLGRSWRVAALTVGVVLIATASGLLYLGMRDSAHRAEELDNSLNSV